LGSPCPPEDLHPAKPETRSGCLSRKLCVSPIVRLTVWVFRVRPKAGSCASFRIVDPYGSSSCASKMAARAKNVVGGRNALIESGVVLIRIKTLFALFQQIVTGAGQVGQRRQSGDLEARQQPDQRGRSPSLRQRFPPVVQAVGTVKRWARSCRNLCPS